MMTQSLSTAMSSRARTCVGCAATIDPSVACDGSGSVRLVRGVDGAIGVDAKGGAFGRGAHVHTRPDCIAGAAERGLARSFKARCEVTAASLASEIAAALDRRIEGLLVSAARTHSLALDPVEAPLLLVAVDAAVATELPAVRAAIAEGQAVAWGTTPEHARLVSGATGGVIAITSEKIAKALGDAVRAKDAALAATNHKFNSRRVRGEAAREAVNPGSMNQAERGA